MTPHTGARLGWSLLIFGVLTAAIATIVALHRDRGALYAEQGRAAQGGIESIADVQAAWLEQEATEQVVGLVVAGCGVAVALAGLGTLVGRPRRAGQGEV